MTRDTWCEARTQGASICGHIDATEDAASRRVAPVRRPGSFPGQAPGADSRGAPRGRGASTRGGFGGLRIGERRGFAAALMEMHHDRKQVFVDRFGWRLPAKGSWLEVDQFDDDYAIYLLARSPEGRHRGSVRLLPSSRPLGLCF